MFLNQTEPVEFVEDKLMLETNRFRTFVGIEFTRNRQNLRFCLSLLACVDSETVWFATDFVAQEPRERKVCVFGVRRPLRVVRQEKRETCTVTFVFVWVYFVNV